MRLYWRVVHGAPPHSGATSTSVYRSGQRSSIFEVNTYQNLCQICHTKIQALPAVFEQLHPTESV